MALDAAVADAIADARGRLHPLRPQRVVSLVPSWTELLFELGFGSRLVGVTEYCVHPSEARARCVDVGGTKTPRIDRIVRLAPDLVVANREENRKLDVERLERAGVPVFVTYARTVPEALDEIVRLSRLMGHSVRLDPLVHAIRSELDRLGRDREDASSVPSREPESESEAESDERRHATPRGVRTLAFVWKDPYMVLGGDCFAHDLLVRCGADNPFEAAGRRYPKVPLERCLEVEPELLLLPTEPYAFSSLDRQAWLALDCPASRRGQVYVVEGELLTWYGPRIPRALRTFGELIATARAAHQGASVVQLGDRRART